MLSLSLNVNAARCALLAVAVAVSAAVDVGHERENESTITRAEASCQGERIGVVVQGGRWARVGRKSWMEPSSVDVSVCDYLCVCVCVEGLPRRRTRARLFYDVAVAALGG